MRVCATDRQVRLLISADLVLSLRIEIKKMRKGGGGLAPLPT